MLSFGCTALHSACRPVEGVDVDNRQQMQMFELRNRNKLSVVSELGLFGLEKKMGKLLLWRCFKLKNFACVLHLI